MCVFRPIVITDWANPAFKPDLTAFFFD